MKYKALIKIGDYNVGEEVPADKAELWLKMYKNPPVEKVSNEISCLEVEEEPKQELEEMTEEDKIVNHFEESEQEEEQEISLEKDNSILDDYLARGVNVVKKNVSEDDLSKEQLEKLLSMEKEGKNRNKVIKAIEARLKEK